MLLINKKLNVVMLIPANHFMASRLRRKHFIFLLLIGLRHLFLQTVFSVNCFNKNINLPCLYPLPNHLS